MDEDGAVEGFALLRGFVTGEGHIRLNRLAARTPGTARGKDCSTTQRPSPSRPFDATLLAARRRNEQPRAACL